ncbi:MAG: DUF5060 domain-containing protein [Eubacteriales bacterium]|nr:DUF5060 domain-containing protein [Eubacteriales bacterium]
MGSCYRVENYRTVDIPVETQKVYNNPFEDVDVFGTFTGPNGESLKLLAFWDDGQTWKLRFAPTSVGTWTFVISSTDPEGEFAGEGTVEAVPYEGDLDMYKHGFLKVSADKRILEYADGTPFFWLGDTHWTFATEERFDESNCPKYASQFKACVDKRVQQKFTVYQSNFRDGDTDGFFGRNIDLMQRTDKGFLPDVKAFQENIDRKMFYIADQGLYHAVGYAWGFDLERNGQDRYKAFAKYVAARYSALPLAWTLAGEVPGYFPAGKQAMIDGWRPVALEGRKWSAYKNLFSVHLAADRPFPCIYADEEWLDFVMSQAGHGDFDMEQSMYAEFVEMYKGHPVLESEATYEGATSNELISRVIPAEMMRRLAYLIMQSGGCGYSYGCNGIWELQWEAGVGGIGWGDMAWWDGLDLPGADQLTIFRDFYESVNWSTLKPMSREEAVTKAFFMESTNRTDIFFTADEARETIVGYMQQTSMRNFELHGLTASEYEVYFVDPATGEKTVEENHYFPENGVLTYTTQDVFANRSDRLVVLKAVK